MTGNNFSINIFFGILAAGPDPSGATGGWLLTTGNHPVVPPPNRSFPCIDIAAHMSFSFQRTFGDAPCFVIAFLTPGGTLFVRLPGVIYPSTDGPFREITK